MPTLQEIFATQENPAEPPRGPTDAAECGAAEPPEKVVYKSAESSNYYDEVDVIDVADFEPCDRCGSYRMWLPVMSGDEEPGWKCVECDGPPNRGALNRLLRVKQKWDDRRSGG